MKKLTSIMLAMAAGIAGAVTNQTPTNVTATSAWARVSVSAGSPVLALHYGAADAGTNLTWAATNGPVTGAVGTVSLQITGLTKASRYYYRWRNLTETNWASGGSIRFYTLGDSPTGTPAAVGYSVTVDPATGVLLAPTNFFGANKEQIGEYVTNVVETDPIYTASVAYAISAGDTAAWHKAAADGAAATGAVALLEAATGVLHTVVSDMQTRTSAWDQAATDATSATGAVAVLQGRTSAWEQAVADGAAATAAVAALETATGAIHAAVGAIEAQTSVWNQAATDGAAATAGVAQAQADIVALQSTTNAFSDATNALQIQATALAGATSALHNRMGNVEAATNALDTRMGVVEALPGVASWSAYAATQNVDFAGYSISNVLEISAIENGIPVLTETFDTDPFVDRWTNNATDVWTWYEAGTILDYNNFGDSAFCTNLSFNVVSGRTYRVVTLARYGVNEDPPGLYTNSITFFIGGTSFTLSNGTENAQRTDTNTITAISTEPLSIYATNAIVDITFVNDIYIYDITPSNSVSIPRLNVTGRLDGLLGDATNAIAELQVATNALDAIARAALPTAGGTMSGDIDMGGASVTNAGDVVVTNAVWLPVGGRVYFGTATNYIEDQAGTNFLFKAGTQEAIFGW